MTVFAVSMVRNEADVIEGMVEHLLAEVDHVIVADNGSTDGTVEILESLPITLLHDREVAYYQSDKMTALAQLAADDGADWIVPVDADELWFGRLRVSEVLEAHPKTVNIVTARMFNHFPTGLDPDESDPFRRLVWRQRDPGVMDKVAFRWEPGAVILQGNHDVKLKSPRRYHALEIRHFPYRTADQFIRKAEQGAAAYAATDLPESWGAHWRSYGAILERHGETALREVFNTHFYYMSPIDNGMIWDPAPYRRWEITDELEITGNVTD